MKKVSTLELFHPFKQKQYRVRPVQDTLFNGLIRFNNPVHLPKRTPKNKPNRLPPLLPVALCLSLVLMACACTKETGLAALPAATQEGKNTFGCLVNGQALVARGSIFVGKSSVDFSYWSDQDFNYYFSVWGTDMKQTEHPRIRIKFSKIIPEQGKTYTIQNNENEGVYAEYIPRSFNDIYLPVSGELTVRRFDAPKGIFSGTFWFDAANAKDEKAAIREGRFDVIDKSGINLFKP